MIANEIHPCGCATGSRLAEVVAVTEAISVLTSHPLLAALAAGGLLLAILAQAIPGARFASRAAIFFGIMAGFGVYQGWHLAVGNAEAQPVEQVRGIAWLVDAGLAGLFAVMTLILTLGRGRGGAVALVLSLLLLGGGLGAHFGWWPDPVMANVTLPLISGAGSICLASGALGLLASIGCLIAEQGSSRTEPYESATPTSSTPMPLPAWMTQIEDEEEHEDLAEETEVHHKEERESFAHDQAPELGHPWTPLRKRAIRRHRQRRATRQSH
jgi:hypothetical protein